MYIRWELVRVIKRADANEPDMFPQAAHVVVAPNRNFAFLAARNVLTGATGRGNGNFLYSARYEFDAIGLK
jgi:hypothetical protein